MIYMSIDATGLLPSFFHDDVIGPLTLPDGTSNPAYPAGVVEITSEQWQDVLSHQGQRKWNAATSTFDLYTPLPVPVPVPDQVTNYQARAILIQRGYLAKVDAALRGADQNQAANQIALAAWDYANTFERGSPIIGAMAQLLGLSSTDVDALFVAAAAVQ